MTSTVPDRQARALPVGRTLRLLVGVILIANVVPIYARVDSRFLLGTGFVVVGLLAAYCLLHILMSRSLLRINSWLGAIVALALLVMTYVAGGLGGVVLGRGEGELATVTFLAVSLLLAAVRGDAGCEVMSVPAALLGGHPRLACIVFSPADRLERKLRGRRAV